MRLILAAAICPLALCAVELRVRVVDPQGLPVAGARVETAAPVALTGEDGTAAVRVDIPAAITVRVAGFEPATRRVDAPDPVVIRLRPEIVRSSIDVVVSDEAGAVTTVGSVVEIERTGARTVFDAVEQVVPGAFVTRRGAMGYGIATNGTGAVTIRGIGSSPNTGVLVIVDGRPDYQGLMGHPLPDFYSLSDVGSLTVVEGPASVLYGSNAMGGVVEVKNWEPPEGMSTRLTSSFGSFYTGQHRLSHGARFDRAFYSVNAGLSHTSGDRPRSAFRDQDGTVTAGYALSPVWKTSVQGRYGHFHVEDPGPVTAPLANSYARVGRGGFSVNLDNATAATWGYARVFSSYGNHYLTDGFRSTDRTTGVRVDQSFAITSRLVLQAGGEAVNYGGRARNATSRLNYGRHSVTDSAGFARAQWTPAARLRLHSGVRYQYDSLAGSIGVPEAGAVFTLAPGYSLSVEVAEGFRNPTIRELYLFPAPNPALRPERMWNYQAAFAAHPFRALAASVTGYYASLDNLIVTTGRYPNLRLLNAGAALNRGMEATARWRAYKRVSVESGYAWLRSTNLAPYVPAHKFNYGVDVDAGRAFFYFGGMSVGARWADAQHGRKLGGYALGTVKASVPVSRRARLTVVVDNIFNRKYQVVAGYPMPGVNGAAGFSVSF